MCDRKNYGFFMGAQRTGSFFCADRCTSRLIDHPIAIGVLLLFCCISTTADLTYLPMTIVIAMPTVNVDMRLSFVFCAPVGSPSAAHHTDAVVTACRNTVCLAAVFTQTAFWTYRTAV